MKKRYEYLEENHENKNIEEPTLSYQRILSDHEIEELILQDTKRPCVFTEEEKCQQIQQGIEDIKKGVGRSMEEVFGKYKK